ncbi:SusD/RagB family nutrient-binding outer membrane lipoprotein [Flexithrix dorotheae]|uniref:SusD/RagB family nutrient-binding outer membrane lipoprotein n=1 Tax=Flexithrix dorotheae TaxID=70993 RepID=UPI00035FF186|nr:SusD/RagB family nutrient-binding outer membrane lipoprotein [Flexithrix dorotheae]
MKAINKVYIILFLTCSILIGCTEQFEEFKGDNENLTSEDISARFFFPNVQTRLWMPPNWTYLFTRVMIGSTYGGYASYGYKNSWEQPDVVFNTTRSWGASADAWNHWSGYYLHIDGFLRLVEPGGQLENHLMEAVGNIMKANYYFMYSEQFGEIPYSEVGQGKLEPKFDEQKVIYKGVIEDLNSAMEVIGDEEATGVGTNDLAEYDILFRGNLQKWKTFANALKLRIALRAKGAPEEDFADAAISEALANPLPTEDVKIVKDLEVSWNIAARDGDFTIYTGSWKMLSDKFVNLLQDNNDPRLAAYADPIVGGEIVLGGYNEPANKEKIDYLLSSTLERSGVPYTTTIDGNDLVVNIDRSQDYYVGQPMRFVDGMKTFLHMEMFSRPNRLTEGVIDIGDEIDQFIMPLSEIYLMQAEAAVLGFGGDANSLFQQGIQASFTQWGVEDNGFLSSPMATLSGSKEEQLGQIGLQQWLALYMVDYQGWAVARDFNLDYVTDDTPDLPTLFSNSIPLGRSYPNRVKYAQPAYDLNGTNLNEAISRQGPDNPATELWFAKGSK